MPSRSDYKVNAEIAIAALFPNLNDKAKEALVWLLVDFLMSLDAIATGND